MGFHRKLALERVPEWRTQYVQYNLMKAVLEKVAQKAPQKETDRQRYFVERRRKFLSFCEKELLKLNKFYSEKVLAAEKRLEKLKDQVLIKASEGPTQTSSFQKLKQKIIPQKNELKTAFAEYYLGLVLLERYSDLNQQAFTKILKKHDKLLQATDGEVWRKENMETAEFATSTTVAKLKGEAEWVFINRLESGNRKKAMPILKVPQPQSRNALAFRVGFSLGLFVALLVLVIITSIFYKIPNEEGAAWIIFRLYRGPMLIIILLFLLGINLYGWRVTGVNYVLIFELDPRDTLSELHVIECAALMGVMWCSSVLGFLWSESLGIDRFIFPLFLIVAMFLFLLNPLDVFQRRYRFWAMAVMGRIIFAPFFFVNFVDFWLADQLNSLIPAILDLDYTICFYCSVDDWNDFVDPGECIRKYVVLRTCLRCLPAWFRFAQSFRRFYNSRDRWQLLNALKYSTTFLVVIFAALNDVYGEDTQVFLILWIVCLVIGSCYSFWWDIIKDWGLFSPPAVENRLLRKVLIYHEKRLYYFAIIEDFFLRFVSSLSSSLTEFGIPLAISADVLQNFLGPMELLRRCVWNFFRLENEHLNNCGKFRAVREVEVPIPTPPDTQQILMNSMMEGNTNVGEENPAIETFEQDDV